MRCGTVQSNPLLNEVLSLNAQESWCLGRPIASGAFLNEVLSLNAQEFVVNMYP